MRPKLILLSATLLTGLALAGTTPGGIAWHEGEVQAAFDRARAEARPLFLYWGAVWCPPCNQIKQTIFTRRDFVEKSRLFVPVYLDGDTERAQVWADKLGVAGYPSMLVLDPEGREVMRLPTGLQAEEFVQVLDQALDRLTPISEIFDAALAAADPDQVPDRSYRLLAYHAWPQDRQLELTDAEREARFRALAERVPPRLAEERSRLYLNWIGTAASLAAHPPEPGSKRFKLSRRQRREADERVHEILATPALTVANLETLYYYAAEVVQLIHPRDNRARRALVDRWLEAMRRAEEDNSLTIRERLSALNAVVDLRELQQPGATAADVALQERVRARVAWADREATDPYARQAAMSTAGYLLRHAGLTEEAERHYRAEVEKSESPFYFMSSLASMAAEAGDTEQAVTWLAKAYESSNGRATRFQWGTNYLLGLMELTPEDGERIRAESARVLEEMMDLAGAFAGRNQTRIRSLTAQFKIWNAEQAHADEVAALRVELIPTCADLSHEPLEGEASPHSRCLEFFETLGAE